MAAQRLRLPPKVHRPGNPTDKDIHHRLGLEGGGDCIGACSSIILPLSLHHIGALPPASRKTKLRLGSQSGEIWREEGRGDRECELSQMSLCPSSLAQIDGRGDVWEILKVGIE